MKINGSPVTGLVIQGDNREITSFSAASGILSLVISTVISAGGAMILWPGDRVGLKTIRQDISSSVSVSLRQWLACAFMCYWPMLVIFHWQRFHGNLRASQAPGS